MSARFLASQRVSADGRSKLVLALEVMGFTGIILFSTLFLTQTTPEMQTPDRHHYLEERKGDRALEFVRSLNAPTLESLKSDPLYEVIKEDLAKIMMAKDRIPSIVQVHRGFVYNFWQDATHIQGIWRRQPLASFLQNRANEWETILDLDALSRAEGKTWVWQGAVPSPDHQRYAISLSPGGGDASVVREFDFASRSFVSNGLGVPEAKTGVAWLSSDAWAVTTNLNSEAVTKSGYPRNLEVKDRQGNSKILANIPEDDMGLFVGQLEYNDQRIVSITHALDFYRFRKGLVEASAEGEYAVRWLEIPLDWELQGYFKDQLIFLTKEKYQMGNREVAAGSLVSLLKTNPAQQILLFEPQAREAVQGVAVKKDAVYFSYSLNVKGRLARASLSSGNDAAWSVVPVEIPDHGVVSLSNTSSDDNDLFYSFESFLVPPSLFLKQGDQVTTVRQLPARFAAEGMKVEQHEAVSSDGEKIPFFVVLPKDFQATGKSPTLLYGYGGFEIPMTPSYLSHWGKVWLERGGVFVLSNIRGGGEFGPAWHRAALKENRQKAYDDFYAIAEKLIAMNYTSPNHLGIEGGSNGGLLTGVSITQRPELFKAAIIAVPLLDMLRYHLHPAGDSWTAEYGNPDNPVERPALERISPYHNLKEGVAYPEVFIWTSTADDRVHPLHARKLAARLQELGQKFYYYENIEGGHGGAANLIQRVEIRSMCFVYLLRKLRAAE